MVSPGKATKYPFSRIGEERGDETDGHKLAPAELWAVSPFARLALHLSKKMSWSTAIAFSTLTFSLAPFVAFWIWMITDHHKFLVPSDLTPMMVLASTLIVLGPLIMILAEIAFGSTFGVILHTAEDGWNVAHIQTAIQKINRIATWVVASFVLLVIASEFSTFHWLQHHWRLGSWHSLPSIAGFMVFFQIGVTSGYGTWQAMKSLVLVRSATQLRLAKNRDEILPPWRPLRPKQVPGIEALGYFAIFYAVGFSFGSTFAPAIFIVALHTSMPATFFLFTAVAVLMLGSTVLFLIPATMIHLLAKKQEHAALQKLALRIEQYEVLLEKGTLDQGLSEQMSLWLSLRRDVRGETAHPESVMILRRLPAAMFIPAVSLAIAFITH